MGNEIIKLIKIPLTLIGDKVDPPLKFLHRKSQYFKLWSKASNLPKILNYIRKGIIELIKPPLNYIGDKPKYENSTILALFLKNTK